MKRVLVFAAAALISTSMLADDGGGAIGSGTRSGGYMGSGNRTTPGGMLGSGTRSYKGRKVSANSNRDAAVYRLFDGLNWLRYAIASGEGTTVVDREP